jgi:hypothetical protein
MPLTSINNDSDNIENNSDRRDLTLRLINYHDNLIRIYNNGNHSEVLEFPQLLIFSGTVLKQTESVRIALSLGADPCGNLSEYAKQIFTNLGFSID